MGFINKPSKLDNLIKRRQNSKNELRGLTGSEGGMEEDKLRSLEAEKAKLTQEIQNQMFKGSMVDSEQKMMGLEVEKSPKPSNPPLGAS